VKLNNKYYDLEYLRYYLPYYIEFKNDKEYYIINRDYKYIGTNNTSYPTKDQQNTICEELLKNDYHTKYTSDINYKRYTITLYKRVFIQEYNSYLDLDYNMRIKYIDEFNKIIVNKKCCNENKETHELIELLKSSKLKILF